MMVGTKAIATLSTGYLNALDYAKSRLQGADLTAQSDKTAPRVTITRHPDVRRIADAAEGVRRRPARAGLLHRDVAGPVRGGRAAGDSGGRRSAEAGQRPAAADRQGAGSERAYELLGDESLQTFGGSGYLQDYPLEQYVRDAKIDTLYEGTTAIQSLDLFFRKIVKDRAVRRCRIRGRRDHRAVRCGRGAPTAG